MIYYGLGQYDLITNNKRRIEYINSLSKEQIDFYFRELEDSLLNKDVDITMRILEIVFYQRVELDQIEFLIDNFNKDSLIAARDNFKNNRKGFELNMLSCFTIN